MPLDQASQQVVSALQALQSSTDRQSQLQANDWLTSFQHSKDAWQVCHTLLFSDEAGLDVKMFAGQTFRAKVIYDISELDPSSTAGLRTSLLTALRTFSVPGSRPVLVQVCLALADLAVQMMEWENVVSGLIGELGKDVQMVPALLEFLRVLPEEAGNPKISITSEEMSQRCSYILSSSSQETLQLLSMYIEAPGESHSLLYISMTFISFGSLKLSRFDFLSLGVDAKTQSAVFEVLRSWLVAGELMASDITQTPLFSFAFQALNSPALFDTAVEVLVDLIHETQEIDDNFTSIQQIVPQVISLLPRLDEPSTQEDPEVMRGFCRIFVEAGETYRPLILQHPETFFPLVRAIATCAASSELEIVKITFNFWYRLSQSLGKRLSDEFSRPFLEIYSGLVEVIINHLHFPLDPDEMNAQERDEFRSFRHTMGDTLKDCCHVLGSTACLKRSCEMIQAGLEAAAANPSSSNTTWQAIEAPLFSLRSMGAEVDPTDNEAVPVIMGLLPSLPNHPKVRYAAILVIGRYTEWIDCHPEHLPFMLQYVSSGFEDADKEVAAAAAQSMRYMCKDCKQHLIPFLPQLHSFLTTVGPSLSQEDVIQVTEAVAFVLSEMPVEDSATALGTFTMPLIQQIHDVTQRSSVGKDDLYALAVLLEQLETFLMVLRTYGSSLPASCHSTPAEVWAILDALLVRFGSELIVSERVCALLRRGITFFGPAARDIVPAMLNRMSSSFESSLRPGYLWITSKLGSAFILEPGGGVDEEIAAGFIAAWEKETEVLVRYLEQSVVTEIPDVMDDFVHLLLEISPAVSSQIFTSRMFPPSFHLALQALTLPAPQILHSTLEYFEALLSHPAIQPLSSSTSASGQSTPTGTFDPSNPSAASQALSSTLADQGPRLLDVTLNGLVTGFPEDAVHLIVAALRVMAGLFPEKLIECLPAVVERLPASGVPSAEKQTFLTKIGSALSTPNPDLVKPAVLGLYRASRRSRERLRSHGRISGDQDAA
ncbi:Nuclear transport regulator [Phaffia rhodozyma]|uniref:Nuclear transport regulator n=1 Tax=Phaffia rhodozyma TaxID=264483 RepID=A0A0F7SK61_PHARH|nr:Nuclear transport regulator [Phaffia rhodozyma]